MYFITAQSFEEKPLRGERLKIAICEDEKIYSDHLTELTEHYFSGHGMKADISLFTDGKPLTDEIDDGASYDIIFLDIQLDNSDGIETAAEIRKRDRKTVLIFVTGLENRAVEGYSVAAFDYIVKSSLEDRIDRVLDRFMKEYIRESITLPLAGDKAAVLPVSDIIWVESDGRGAAAGTSDAVYRTVLSVSKIAPLLPSDLFAEIYLSVYVQVNKIRYIGEDTVEMTGGKILPVSRRKRKNLMAAVMKNVRGGMACRAKDIH